MINYLIMKKSKLFKKRINKIQAEISLLLEID